MEDVPGEPPLSVSVFHSGTARRQCETCAVIRVWCRIGLINSSDHYVSGTEVLNMHVRMCLRWVSTVLSERLGLSELSQSLVKLTTNLWSFCWRSL